jgi:hypothetical protein
VQRGVLKLGLARGKRSRQLAQHLRVAVQGVARLAPSAVGKLRPQRGHHGYASAARAEWSTESDDSSTPVGSAAAARSVRAAASARAPESRATVAPAGGGIYSLAFGNSITTGGATTAMLSVTGSTVNANTGAGARDADLMLNQVNRREQRPVDHAPAAPRLAAHDRSEARAGRRRPRRTPLVRGRDDHIRGLDDRHHVAAFFES